MSPATSQQWTRRIRYSDQHIRVSDAERNAVAELLGQHYADGRLDQAEFDDRVSQTMSAKTRGDLAGLFDDLPEAGPAGAGPAGPGGPADTAPYRGPRRRSGVGRTLLLLLLVFICANVAWHAFTSLFFIQPLVWAFVIVAVILLVNRSARRRDR
jgi:Flp pilus assembly protein TadB